MDLSPTITSRLALFSALLSLAGAAVAQQSYDLRVFTTRVGFPCCDSDVAAIQSTDLFNNGNPLAGPAWVGAPGTVSYTPQNAGFSPGSELSGPDSDFYGNTYGVGRLRLSVADATPVASNLDAPGTVTLANRIRLDSPGLGPLLNRGQSFEVATYWNFTTPDAGSSYGIRLTDNPVLAAVPGSPAFNDLIDLRVVRNSAGQPLVQLRRLVWDGNLFTIPEVYAQDIAAALFAGHTLGDVAVIELNQHYNTGIGASPYLLTMFNLNDASGNQIGHYQFGQNLTIFNGEDFSRVVAGANFTVPVPEPATGLMLLGGLAVLGAARRRRP